jgi:hypothetical protein
MSEYNNHEPLRYLSNNIIEYLIDNNDIIWKLLKYQEPDALNKPNLTREEKSNLIYKGWVWDGTQYVLDDSSDKAVFRQPWIDDANTSAVSMLRVYLSTLVPETRITTVSIYTVELVVHNKNVNILSNLGDEENETPVSVENRLELLVQQVLKTLNGARIGGIGEMFFDMEGNYMTKGMIGLYNNRNYYGFKLALGVRVNGTE